MSEEQTPKKKSIEEQLREELKRKGHPDYQNIELPEDKDKPAPEELLPLAEPKAQEEVPVLQPPTKPTPNVSDISDVPTIDRTADLSAQRAKRPSETEHVFRRYEPYIALASYGSYTIDPSVEPLDRTRRKGVGKHTFTVYFRDAVAAYFVHKYSSVKISPTLQCNDFSLTELNNGCVKITHKRRNRSFSSAEVHRLKPYFTAEMAVENGVFVIYDQAFYDKLTQPQQAT